MDRNWSFFVVLGFFALLLIGVSNGFEVIEDKIQFEAAFQGRCGHASPCEQLCYELHDGMYECDCKSGFILRPDGYSCYEINSTLVPAQFDDGENDILYEKDAVFDAFELVATQTNDESNLTRQEPSPSLQQTILVSSVPHTNLSIITKRSCLLDCGSGGGCKTRDDGTETCLCPLGRIGKRCKKVMEIRSPLFTGSSWLAFPALRGAYKHVQLSMELRPEAYDGIFFLTGERDDMAGDFMALLLHRGFVEFRFDCGSGVGIVRSEETILLNKWNRITLYRHRWDAWLQLNNGKHVQGRSKGLFSRITFREPLFIGGVGNTTGLGEKLPVGRGFKGCIRHLEVNDHMYNFALEPKGDATKGYGIEECTADRCSRVPCQHGGKCLTSGNSTACLCLLGFTGDLCELRVDLQVPSFNGSSHLRYRGIGDEGLTWLDLEIILKPTYDTGLVLYNGHHSYYGDFIALYLKNGFVEFVYDLGTGVGTATSREKISLGKWHKIKISRTGRLCNLQVDSTLPVEVFSPGAFTQLSLPFNLYLGGVPNYALTSRRIVIHTYFIGCIQSVQINGRPLSILAKALGGANVDNCPHPCVTRPCGNDGECIPELEYFSCRCRPGYRDEICARGPPAFRGVNSYLFYMDDMTLEALASDPLDVNVRFRVSSASQNGLLLWIDAPGGFLSLGLEMGALVLRFGVREEEVLVVYNSTAVHDNLWHRIKAVRYGSSGTLIVDNGLAATHQSIEIPEQKRQKLGGLYVGGMPPEKLKKYTRYSHGIRGCVADLVINTDYHLQLINHIEVGHNVGKCKV